jgi:hypothetical protein
MVISLVTEENREMTEAAVFKSPLFERPIIVIVGGFGSGKTEISVNLARYFASSGESQTVIADLDLVNPYFRSRETVEKLDQLGVRTVAPTGGHHYADLPILLPEIKGLIENPSGKIIIDVGGDSQGTKALGSMGPFFIPDSYDLLMVINSRRPQTDNVEVSLRTMDRIESAAGLKFTGLIANSHLIEETSAEIIMEGYDLARRVGDKRRLPICFIGVKDTVLSAMNPSDFDCAVLPLSRLMLKPWEK